MPTSDGRIYAREVNGVKTGISTAEVAKVLNITSLDVGTQCRSKKINGRSRYRPVPWNTPQPANCAAILNGHSRGEYWDEANLTSGVRPWFYGSSYGDDTRAIVAPELNNWGFDSLIDTNGNVNTAAMWKYNYPAAGTFAHLDHFHGYNHYAVLPFRGWVNGGVDKPTGIEISSSTGKLLIGFDFAENDNGEPVGKRDGCWSVAELIKELGFVNPVHLTVVIRNNTAVTNSQTNRYKYTIGSVATIDLNNFDPSEGFRRELKIYDGSSMEVGGVGSAITNNDVIDVMVCLTDNFETTTHISGSTPISGRSLFSENLTSACKRFKVVMDAADHVTQKVKYNWKVSRAASAGDWFDFDGYIYLRGADFGVSDVVFRCSRCLSNIQANSIIQVYTTDTMANGRNTMVKTGYGCKFLDQPYLNFFMATNTYNNQVFSSNGTIKSYSISSTNNIKAYGSAADAAAGQNWYTLDYFVPFEWDPSLGDLNPQEWLPIPEDYADVDSTGHVGTFYDLSDQVEAYIEVACTPQWNDNVTTEQVTHYVGETTYTGSMGLIQLW